MRVRPPWIALVALTATLAGCATTRGPVSTRPAAPPGTVETGEASWYGEHHQGRRTANGERYDMYRLTAAHPVLPLGTKVLVTNLQNGRSVEVRVNDRVLAECSRWRGEHPNTHGNRAGSKGAQSLRGRVREVNDPAPIHDRQALHELEVFTR